MANALDERPLPWIAVIGVYDAEDPLYVALRSVGGTVTFASDLADIRQLDYTILIQRGTSGHAVASHLNVLQFWDERMFGLTDDYSPLTGQIFVSDGARAARFEVGKHADARGLGPLVKQSLLSEIPVGEYYQALQVTAVAKACTFEVLAAEVEGMPLAGIRTNHSGSEWWILPALTTSADLWLRAALSMWREQRPDGFPPPGFGTEEKWMSYAELKASKAISAHEAETEALLSERELALDALLRESAEAMELAKTRERRLLATNGDDLVEAVSDALTELGFTVIDADAIALANSAAKREDLRIRYGDDWEALVEVKGKSTRSAATNDLFQLTKAAGFYIQKTGREPNALWYIVNANFSLPPDERPIPLATSAEDVDVFASDGGAVIDTREIFQLLRNVKLGEITRQDAAESLTKANGIYQAPSAG